MDVRNTGETPSADEVLDFFQEIILSGVTISAAFSDPVRLDASNTPAPFALRIIDAAGRRGLSQADLARALDRSAPWTTRLIDALERDGLIIRTAHPSDRRVNMLTLSSQGHEALHNFVDMGRAAVVRLFPNQTTTSLSQFRALLNRFCILVSTGNHFQSASFNSEKQFTD